MSATAQNIAAAAPAKSWAAVYADLIKARLTLLVLLTTLVGFYMGSEGGLQRMLLLSTIIGTALVAAGASWRGADGR